MFTYALVRILSRTSFMPGADFSRRSSMSPFHLSHCFGWERLKMWASSFGWDSSKIFQCYHLVWYIYLEYSLRLNLFVVGRFLSCIVFHLDPRTIFPDSFHSIFRCQETLKKSDIINRRSALSISMADIFLRATFSWIPACWVGVFQMYWAAVWSSYPLAESPVTCQWHRI
jgi:hypothetical protein